MALLDKQQAKDILKSAKEKTSEMFFTAKTKSSELIDDLKQQEQNIRNIGFSEKAIETTKTLIIKLADIPVVRVNRDDFLKQLFGNSPYIDDIIKYGPQRVFTVDSLREKADEIIRNSTRKSAVASFAASLPSSVAVMVPASVADVAQYYGFALNLAQKIAYLFGENQLFTSFDPAEDMIKTDGTYVPESAQVKIIAYLGVMLGVRGAGALVVKTAQSAGAEIGKKVARQALTKTAWYPLLKKVASVLGIKITKQTVQGTITKSVPVIGGIVSGVITYKTFKPLGSRLADVFAKLTNGEFDINMELNSDYEKELELREEIKVDYEAEIIEAQFEDIDEHPEE